MMRKKFLLNNFGLKLLALVLAVIAWIYIVGELNKATPEEKAALERLLPYRMTAKYLTVKINLAGKLKEGYSIETDKMALNPEGIMVVGPRSLLDRTSSIKTEPIDLSEHTKTFTKNVRLMPLAKGLTVKEKFITITIPIKKIRN